MTAPHLRTWPEGLGFSPHLVAGCRAHPPGRGPSDGFPDIATTADWGQAGARATSIAISRERDGLRCPFLFCLPVLWFADSPDTVPDWVGHARLLPCLHLIVSKQPTLARGGECCESRRGTCPDLSLVQCFTLGTWAPQSLWIDDRPSPRNEPIQNRMRNAGPSLCSVRLVSSIRIIWAR